MRTLLLFLLLPLTGFSQITDTCQVEFEFVINSESRQVKFSRSSDSVIVLSYLWDFGDGNSSVLGEPTHLYSQPGTYIACLTVTTENNCISTFCDTVIIETIPSMVYNLQGTVITNTSVLPAGIALLIRYVQNEFVYTAFSQVISGQYEFTDIDPGEYLVQVIPVFDVSGYYFPFYLPTYSGSKLIWQQAQHVYVYSNNTVHNIQLCSFNGIITGNQSIRGKISYSPDAHYEEDLFNMNWQTGSPISNTSENAVNIPVLLYNEAGACIKATLTDAGGEFVFGNLPYGKYAIEAEKAGVLSAPVQVNLQTSADAQTVHYIRFNSNGFVSSLFVEKYKDFRIFPVPASDILFFSEATGCGMEICTVAGISILQFGSGIQQADISKLPAGFYYIRFADGNVFRFVKER